MDLVALLREFFGDEPTAEQEALIALAARWAEGELSTADGDDTVVMTWAEGEPMTDDELTTLADGLTALADDTEAGLGLLTAAADVVTEVNTETAARVELAEAEDAALEAERRRLRGETDDEPEAEGDDPADSDTDDEGENGDGEGADDESGADATADEPEPVLAGAGRRAPLSSLARRSGARSGNRAPATATAQGNRIQLAAGVEVSIPRGGQPTREHIDQALAERISAFVGSGIPPKGTQEKIRVARVFANFSEDRRLTSGPIGESGQFVGAEEAARRVAAAFQAARDSGLSVQAAGGFCALPQPLYAAETFGEVTRPIRDTALTSFQASRGRVIQLPPPRLASVLPSVGIWTNDDDVDAASDPDVRKSTMRITCAEPVDSEVQAIYASLIWGELLGRTYSEWVQAFTRLSTVAHARVAEQELFDQIVALSTPLSLQDTTLSATRDFVNYFARLAWHFRARNRENRAFPFRLVTDVAALDIMAEDLAVSMHGESNDENLAQAERIINGALAARRINVTWSNDLQVPGAQGDNTTAANYPTSVPFAFYPEGTFLHLDQGTLDVGIMRDSALVEANDVKTFVETFEGVHRTGAREDARTGRINVCPNGAVYGTEDPSARCASYT